MAVNSSWRFSGQQCKIGELSYRAKNTCLHNTILLTRSMKDSYKQTLFGLETFRLETIKQ